MVATWKTQAAPTFDAALKAAQDANDSMASGRDRISDAASGVMTSIENTVMNQAKTALMNLDTDQAREEFLTENPSSFHDADKLKTFREEMMKTDGAREKESHKLTILSQSKILDSIKDPNERREQMNKFQFRNDTKGINDDEGMHTARMDKMLQGQQFEVTPETIKQAHGNPESEFTFNEDVQQRVFDIIDENIRSQYYGASAKTIEAKRNEALAASPYGARFTRRIKRREEMTDLDVQAETLSHNITDNIGKKGPEAQAKLVNAVNQGMKFYLNNATQLSDDQKQWLKGPVLKALDGENIDADQRWDEINAGYDIENPGSKKNQKRFHRVLSEQLKEKFPTLDQDIIDTHIRTLISRSGLETMIGKGNMIDEFQTKLDRKALEQVGGYKEKIVGQLLKFRDEGVATTIRKNLEESINKRWGKDKDGVLKVVGVSRNDLIKQTANTVKKIKSAFLVYDEVNNTYRSSLNKTQEATLELGIYRFLTSVVGYDPDDGYIPWDRPDYVIADLGTWMGQGKDMSDNSINVLLEGLKEHLPKRGDRLPDANKPGAVILEDLIGEYQKRNPEDNEQKLANQAVRSIIDNRLAAGLADAQRRIKWAIANPALAKDGALLAKARKDEKKYKAAISKQAQKRAVSRNN